MVRTWGLVNTIHQCNPSILAYTPQYKSRATENTCLEKSKHTTHKPTCVCMHAERFRQSFRQRIRAARFSFLLHACAYTGTCASIRACLRAHAWMQRRSKDEDGHQDRLSALSQRQSELPGRVREWAKLARRRSAWRVVQPLLQRVMEAQPEPPPVRDRCAGGRFPRWCVVAVLRGALPLKGRMPLDASENVMGEYFHPPLAPQPLAIPGPDPAATPSAFMPKVRIPIMTTRAQI